MARVHPDDEPLSEILCLGETMVLLASPKGLPLASAATVDLFVAGAESNVASGLAHFGHGVEWFGRVGNDPFGNRILTFLHDKGVNSPGVRVDRARPTGVYFKDQAAGNSTVYYYRARSAASAMTTTDLADLRISERRLCHVSGITAALSSTCDDALQRIIVERDPGTTLISFDVNYRPGLWDVATAAPRLLELARASDIVVVGRDEADTLWTTGETQGVRDLLPDVPQLIVKDAHLGATHFNELGSTFVPALAVEVLEPVGAGDAFAAGFLSGFLHGWDAKQSLRLGHIMAGFTLRHVSDLPELPAASDIIELTTTSDSVWSQLDVSRMGDALVANA